MMAGWLARLKNEKTPDLHPREPREPAEQASRAGFLGLLAPPPAPFQKSEGDNAANDPAAIEPDRWCWPYSPAMNSGEMDTFMARLAGFADKGLSMDEAEALADKLVSRDREADDRRLCLECSNLQGSGRWRSCNAREADVPQDGLALDLVLIMHRCRGFREVRYE